MPAMPLPFLLSRLAGLISLVILVSGLWFTADWLGSDHRSGLWLVTGLVMLGFALFGRPLIALSLRPHRERDRADPPRGEVEAITGAGAARLHVECFGPKDAPRIVLTHAWGLDSTTWDDAVRDLSACYRVVVWDMPGLGFSGRPFDGVYSVERLATDLRAVLAATGDKPALLVGQGTGAIVVLELCRADPHLLAGKIAGIALLNGADARLLDASVDSTLLRSVREVLIDPLLRLGVAVSPFMHLMAWASYLNGLALLVARSTAFGPDPARIDVDCASWAATRHAPSVLAKGLRAFLDWDGAGVARELNLPLLAVGSREDMLIKVDCVRATAEAAPLGRFVEVEGVGHLGVLERPEVYDELLQRHAEHVFDRARRGGAGAHAEVMRKSRDIPGPAVVEEPRSFARSADSGAADHRDAGNASGPDIGSSPAVDWSTRPLGHA
jgi:pimeloyl-ACP methyl ester carboxylesterase